MKLKRIYRQIVLIMTLVIAGCQDENILTGQWELDKNDVVNRLLTQPQIIELEFTDKQMKIRNHTNGYKNDIDVIYKRRDENTIVLFTKGQSLEVNIIDKNTISLRLQHIGRRQYIRKINRDNGT